MSEPASRPPVPFVGLTGGIGAGKSTALEALDRLGAATLSTDRVVHGLYETAEVRELVIAHFGHEVMRTDTDPPEVDRGALAARAFATAQERHWLEQLLWPRVGEAVVAWRAHAERATPPPRALVVETPLLFEAGLDRGYDATIAVVADEAVRHQRAGGRGHAALDERTARQLSQEEKAQRATYTVVNDSTVSDLETKLSTILDRLTE